MRVVVAFQSHQALLGHAVDPLVQLHLADAQQPAVRQHRHAARVANVGNDLLGGHLAALNIGLCPHADVFAEGGAHIGHQTVRDEHLRDVRTADGAACHRFDLLHGDRDAHLLQVFDDALHAFDARGAHILHHGLHHRVIRRHAVAQHMHLQRHAGADLYAGHHVYVIFLSRFQRFGNTAHGVMVGHGNQRESLFSCQLHHLRRGQRPVRRGGMDVQIQHRVPSALRHILSICIYLPQSPFFPAKSPKVYRMFG